MMLLNSQIDLKIDDEDFVTIRNISRPKYGSGKIAIRYDTDAIVFSKFAKINGRVSSPGL